jgi:altronate hydrolase
MNQSFLLLNLDDNVCVVVNGGCAGSMLTSQGDSSLKLVLVSDIPRGHKAAFVDIKAGSPVFKYGEPIGIAAQNIRKGEHVHVHNVAFDKTMHFDRSRLMAQASEKKGIQGDQYFRGYLRPDGRAGVRNYITVVSTSNCSASVVKQICRQFPVEKLAAKNIDGVVPVTYGHGCALAVGGEGYTTLVRTLVGWIDHPNVVGALIVSLGCDSVNCGAVESLVRSDLPLRHSNCLRSFSVQDAGGYHKAIEKGLLELDSILDSIQPQERTCLPVSKLVIALNCGGSDAYSGLTANPAVGKASDLLVSQGGAVVLAEIPECYGAEGYLMARCEHPEDRGRIEKMFKWWEDYVARHGIEMNDNMSVGNIEGGITTILEKSLGAIMKGGSTAITQTVEYAERISRPGLVLMNTPGYDPVSMTGLVAGGCVLGLFTTGRGSLYGCSIAPVIKIASNTTMYERMCDDMDINAGVILEGQTIGDVAEMIYSVSIRVANGNKTASEKNTMGLEEFVPWNPGETL